MATTRRKLFGALAAIPAALGFGKLAQATPEEATPISTPEVAPEHFTVRMGDDGELMPLVVPVSEMKFVGTDTEMMKFVGTNIPFLDARFSEAEKRFGKTWGRYKHRFPPRNPVERSDWWQVGGLIVLPREFLAQGSWELKRWDYYNHGTFLNEIDDFAERRITGYMNKASKETFDVLFSWRVAAEYAVVCGHGQVEEAVALIETPDRSTEAQYRRMFRAA